MIDEYIDDFHVLVSEINTAHNFVLVLIAVEKNLKEEMQK